VALRPTAGHLALARAAPLVSGPGRGRGWFWW
jgi:hypothetical protein